MSGIRPSLATAPRLVPSPRVGRPGAAYRPGGRRARGLRPGWAAWLRRVGYRGLPLLAILGIQAAFSLRLIWLNTSFQDEALYLWAGHLEIAHVLHGTPIPAFPTYFSGAPVLYPPLGALADSADGLAGARLLSLAFMLATTSLLWAVARRLLGSRAAFFAAALFATLGATERLGAFATFDAMSVCLLAAAAWCAVRAAESRTSQGWLAAAAVALALANAAKYASAIFDPVVAGLLILMSLQLLDRKRALLRGLTMLGYAAGALVFLYAIGGSEYGTGIAQTTVARAYGTDTAAAVLLQSWHLTAIVAILGFAGALTAVAGDTDFRRSAAITLLGGTALLVPLQQARIHSMTSLDKHVDFGMWFAAVAAGYLADRLLGAVVRPRVGQLLTAACVLLLVIPVMAGRAGGKALFASWPNSAALVETVARVLPMVSGPVLAEHPSLFEYYLPQGAQWNRWSSTRSIRLPDGRSLSTGVGHGISAGAYAQHISSGYFSLVILDFGATDRVDRAIVADLEANPHYRLIAGVPYGQAIAEVWVYRPRSRSPIVAPYRPVTPFYRGLLTPAARPSPILGAIVASVEATGIATLGLMLLIRFAWRRGKGSGEV